MSYFIREDYTPRLDNEFAHERGKEDQCQDEVYKATRELMDRYGLESVFDLGTGGGFKLLKYFRDKKTLGTDLSPNIEWVMETYPDRDWDFSSWDNVKKGYDVIICSDVIEHLIDPDELLRYIVACNPKFAVISTPNRDNLQEWSWPGPPRNTCHVREWSAPEYRRYMEKWFNVVEHVFPDPSRRDYSTMWVVVKPFELTVA